MIKFLLKGILRDKSRSVLPIIVISIGVALTVMLSGYMKGVFGDMTDQNARFSTGHLKVMTKAYAENIDQLPNDLALLGVEELTRTLEADYPDYEWESRIRFGGLVDAPDENGESERQGASAGMGLNLLDAQSGEIERMNIESSLVSGSLPSARGEVLLGDEFAQKLNVSVGDDITYFGSTMNGSMTFQNFIVSGTIRFGSAMMDKGLMIVDISDARQMLDMEDGAGEVLGFSRDNAYKDAEATELAIQFNELNADSDDEFGPVMKSLRQQNNLSELLDYSDMMSGIFIFIFVGAMSVVLWNTGLIAGLRRYNEFGIRLALGEAKGTIYRRLLLEATLIGIIGSVVGTIIGLAGVYYLQVVGIDISSFMENSSMLMPSVLRAKITPELFFIGFIPGLLAMLFGSILSGIGIFKRETANLMKELEV